MGRGVGIDVTEDRGRVTTDIVIRENRGPDGAVASITVMQAPDTARISTALLDAMDPRLGNYDPQTRMVVLASDDGAVLYHVDGFEGIDSGIEVSRWANVSRVRDPRIVAAQ